MLGEFYVALQFISECKNIYLKSLSFVDIALEPKNFKIEALIVGHHIKHDFQNFVHAVLFIFMKKSIYRPNYNFLNKFLQTSK